MNIEQLNKEIGQQLIRARKALGVSQQQAALRAGVFGNHGNLDQTRVSILEKRPLTVDFIDVLSYLDILEIDVNDFVKEIYKYSYDTGIEAMRMHNTSKPSDVPVVGIFGRQSARKVDLVNIILGLTRIFKDTYNTLITHISVRPSTLKHSVAVFKEGFSPVMLRDASLVERYLLCEGDKSILQHKYAGSVLVMMFEETELLQHIQIFKASSDSKQAADHARCVDAAILMSNANDFLTVNDRSLLLGLTYSNPKLVENTLLVATEYSEEAANDIAVQLNTITTLGVGKELPIVAFHREIPEYREKTITRVKELLRKASRDPIRRDSIVKADIYSECEAYRKTDILEMKSYFIAFTDRDNLAAWIDELYTDASTAQEEIGLVITQNLVSKLSDIITTRAKWINSLTNYNPNYVLNAPVIIKDIEYIVYRYVGGTWQDNLAKKVANVIRGTDIWNELENAINLFWDDAGLHGAQ